MAYVVHLHRTAPTARFSDGEVSGLTIVLHFSIYPMHLNLNDADHWRAAEAGVLGCDQGLL
jgi:hypothetical protein